MKHQTTTNNSWVRLLGLALLLSCFTAFTANAQISVTATAGTLGPTAYTTLGGAGGAFAAINAGTHQGAITISITGNVTETAACVLNSSGAGTASYTSVLIQPTVDGVTISGPTVTGRGLIELNGADNVTIDGDNPNTSGTNRNLTITNTAANTVTYTMAIRVAVATSIVTTADNVTIRNCIVNGSATGRNIASATSTTATENVSYGIYAGGGASTVSATTAPSAISSATTVVGTGATMLNLTINNNQVNACARGIAVQGSAVTVIPTLNVNNNLVGPATSGSTTSVYSMGITLQGFGAATVTGNTIRNMESFVGTSIRALDFGSISTSGTNATVANNIITKVNLQNTTTYGVYGINVAAGNGFSVRNNFVTDLQSNMSGGAAFSTSFGIFGIRIAAGLNHLVYHNSVNLYGLRAGTATTSLLSAALIVTGTGLTGCDIRNNVLSNTISGGTTSIANVSIALPSGGTSAMNLTLNNNAYYSGTDAARQGLAQVGTTAGTGFYLASNFNAGVTTPASNLRSYTSTLSAAGTNDNASFAVTTAAPFTSNADLHINLSAPNAIALNASGANGTGVTLDIDGDTRGTPPDMGADEFPLATCSGTPTAGSISGSVAACSGALGTLNLTGATSGVGISYQWRSSSTPGGPYTTLLGTGTTQPIGPMSATTYYVVEVTCSFGGTATTSEWTVTVNPLPTVSVSPTSGTYCSPGGTAIGLTASGASTYTWSPAAGLNATTGASVNATPGSTTTYTVTGSDANSCTATATSAITVSPGVNASNVTATPNPVCDGGTSQLNISAGTTEAYTVSSATYGLLSGSGTAIGTTGDDALLGTVTLPFNFNFFGATYSTLYVHSNGFVSFSSGQPTGSPYTETIPTAATPNNYIAICHDDMNVNVSGSVTQFTVGTTPNRIFVINWSGVKFYNGGSNNGDMSGQIQLFERDSHIEIHVTSSNDPTASAHAIGIENAGGTLGYAPAGRNNVTYSFTNATPEAWAFYPSGGSISYSWSPATFLNNTTISNPQAVSMTAGETYTVTATSASGCSATRTITVTVGAPLSTTATASSISVCDGQTVNLTATPSGGGTPYTYVWNDGGSDIGFTSPFTYDPDDSRTTTFTVTVTDACGSTATATVDVTSNALPVVNISGGTLICGTGSVTLTADGANTYAWTPGGSTTNPLTASPTATTTYTVVGTDGNGCTASNTWVVNVAPAVTSPAASASPNPACDGATVNLTSSASVAGYTIGAGGTSYTDISTTGTAVTGTPADDSEHNLTILPFTFNGVSYTALRIGNNGKIVLGATTGEVGYSNVALPYPLTGLGATTAGSVAMMPFWDDLTPGTGNSIRYQTIGSKLYIQWTNEDHFSAAGSGTVTFQIQMDYSDGRIYFVYPDVDFVGPPTLSAQDRAGSATVGLQFSASSFLQYSFNTQSVNNGQVISFTPSSLTYAWSGPSFSSSLQNPSITGATAANSGTYTVTMTSNAGCTNSATVSLTVYNPLSATASLGGNVTCNGGNNGSASVSASGGSGSYSYSWAPSGGTAASATGLTAGTYTVTVTDASCGTASSTVTISEPSALIISCTPSNPSCFGGNNGQVVVSASGGTGSISGTGTFTGLSAGAYSYTVTDANGCTASCSGSLVDPAQLIASCSASNVSCPGGNDGSVTVSATGGTGSISGTGTFSGLTDGVYNYTVTDANGCTASCSATVGTSGVNSTDPTGATASASNICLGNNVTLSVVGGSLGTGANWVWYAGACGVGAPIGTGASISYTPPSAGTYPLFVRAVGSCNTTACASVTVVVSSGAPTGTISITSAPTAGCVGGSDVITTNSVLGATGYNWSGPPSVLFNGQPSPYISATNSVTVSYTSLPTGGQSGWNICVQAVNACGASPNTKCTWIRATLTQPGAITGSIIACPSTSGTYSILPVAGAASYQWTATGAGMSVSGTGTSATVTFGAGFTSGTLCVSGVTSCGYVGASRCMTISNAPVIPGTIAGPSTICPGGSASFSIAAVPGAASYIWSTTGAGASVVGSGTSATVNTTSGFTAGSVCVVAVSSCGSPIGNSPQRCKTISSGKLGTPGNITGDPTSGVCGQTYTYSIPPMSGATSYTWSLPSGATGSSSTNSITVTFSGGFTSGQICVNGNNACGAGFQRCITVSGNPANVTGLTTSTPSPCSGTDILVTWNATNGAASYDVLVPVGYTVLSGSPTTNTFAIVNVSGANGSIGVRANSSCGNSGTATLAITPVGCRVAGAADVAAALRTEVFPNPTTGMVNIRFNSESSDMQYVVNVTDLSGRVVLSERNKAFQGSNLHTLDLSGMAKGTYLVSLLTENGNEVVRVTVE